MTTWKPDPQTYDQALHEIGCLEAQVADLQEQLAEAHRKIVALTEAQASGMPHNASFTGLPKAGPCGSES